MDKQYREEYTKIKFIEYTGTDADYLIIAETDHILGWVTVPSPYGVWETIDQSIESLFTNSWTTIRVYDLYAETVEQALVSVHSR